MRMVLLSIALLTSGATAAEEPIRLVAPDGSEVELRAPSGEDVVVLHFFASWCPSCPEDLAGLAAAAAECTEAHLRVFAVDVDEAPEDAVRFAAQHAPSLPVLLDPKGRAWRRLDGRGVPMNVTWSARELRTQVGPRTREDWERELGAVGCRSAPPPGHDDR